MTTMNPWEIVGWIGAVCVALLIVTLTLSLVVSLTRSMLNPSQARRQGRVEGRSRAGTGTNTTHVISGPHRGAQQ